MSAGGAEVEADLGHGLDDRRIDGVSRCGAGGADNHAVAPVVSEQRRGHLRTSGVVHADEKDFGTACVSHESSESCSG